MTSRQVKPQGAAHPSCSTGSRPERLPFLEHLRALEIGGQVVDRMRRAIEVGDHDEQREVDACFHTVVLWPPCSSHERRRESADVGSPRGLDLGKISAKITNDVSATEVDGQPPERTFPLAPWAGQSRDDALAVITQFLMRCTRHSRKVLRCDGLCNDGSDCARLY